MLSTGLRDFLSQGLFLFLKILYTFPEHLKNSKLDNHLMDWLIHWDDIQYRLRKQWDGEKGVRWGVFGVNSTSLMTPPPTFLLSLLFLSCSYPNFIQYYSKILHLSVSFCWSNILSEPAQNGLIWCRSSLHHMKNEPILFVCLFMHYLLWLHYLFLPNR